MDEKRKAEKNWRNTSNAVIAGLRYITKPK